ncbi:MAG TPA: hypothetical protein VGK34_10550 [Armatimonadota bacterium]|jgi:hypothetical protein
MRNTVSILVIAAMLVLLLAVTCSADPSYLGISGNLFTPDDKVLAPGQFAADYNQVEFDNKATFIAGSFGVTDGLELSVVRFDSDGADSVRTGINLKYSIMPETAATPSLVIGATDVTGDMDINEDPGLFVVLGKNLTPAATNLAGQPMKPIRGYIGYSGGLNHGLFAGASCELTQKTSLVVEYMSKLRLRDTYDQSSLVNAGLRLDITDTLRANVSLIDLKEFGFGMAYNKTF